MTFHLFLRASYSGVMAALDSEAVLLARMAELGLEGLSEAMHARGWKTTASFAFAVPPSQQPDDAQFRNDVILRLVADMDDPRVPALRRLHFESYTIAVVEMRRPAA